MREVKPICPVGDTSGDSAYSFGRKAGDDQRIIFQRMAPMERHAVSKTHLRALAARYPDCFVCVVPAGWHIEVAGEPQPEEYKEGVCVPATTSG